MNKCMLFVRWCGRRHKALFEYKQKYNLHLVIFRVNNIRLFVRYPDKSQPCKKNLLFNIYFFKNIIFKFSLCFLWSDLAELTGFASFTFICKILVCW